MFDVHVRVNTYILSAPINYFPLVLIEHKLDVGNHHCAKLQFNLLRLIMAHVLKTQYPIVLTYMESKVLKIFHTIACN